MLLAQGLVYNFDINCYRNCCYSFMISRGCITIDNGGGRFLIIPTKLENGTDFVSGVLIQLFSNYYPPDPASGKVTFGDIWIFDLGRLTYITSDDNRELESFPAREGYPKVCLIFKFRLSRCSF